MGNCCYKNNKTSEKEEKKSHQRGQPSTVSYDFERQKGMHKALKDLTNRRQPIKVKTLGKRKDANK